MQSNKTTASDKLQRERERERERGKCEGSKKERKR